MAYIFDKFGRSAHVPAPPLISEAGYVQDPYHALVSMGHAPDTWYYAIPYNPGNFKPEVFEGYPAIHTLHHEPK